MDSVTLSAMDRDCASLGGLFQSIVHELKGSPPVWEDFIAKATKLHHQLKATILATGAFLDCFQKVADMATSSKGSTRDIGSALTRLCMRHRNLEAKSKQFSRSIMDCLVGPLQDKIPDWKTTSLQLDKDHAKEYKRLRADIKRVNAETIRLEKKYKKSAGRGDVAKRLELSRQELADKYLILEENEKAAVRQAMIEERSRFCLFVSFLKPVMDEEASMITEVSQLQEIVEFLVSNSNDPFTLPKSSEQVINDMKGQDSTVWAPFHSTPPSSPSSIGSRKSSVCSISSFNSISSGSTTGTGSGLASNHISNGYPSSPQSHATAPGTVTSSCNTIASASAPVTRRSNSQDSGFTSQDTLFLRPQGLTPPVNWKQEDSPPVLSTFLPAPEGPSTSHGVLHSATPTSTTPTSRIARTTPLFRDPLQPPPPPPLSLNTPLPRSPRHNRRQLPHPPTPPSVPPPPTPDSGPNTPTPQSPTESLTPHYQTPSSPPRLRSFPPITDSSDKKKSTAPPIAPPPPPPRQPPITQQPLVITPSLQTTQDGYALPQSAAMRSGTEAPSNDAKPNLPTSSSPSSPSSSNSSSTPSSPYPSTTGEGGQRTAHPLEGLTSGEATALPTTSVADQATRPASDDGYNSGGGLSSQLHNHNSSFGSTSTKSTTPPPAAAPLPTQSFIQRRGSTVSMPPGDLDAGSSTGHYGSSSPLKPPIPDKPPPIARKPSLKPALKNSPNPPAPVSSSMPDYNQITPHQVVPQPVVHPPSSGEMMTDPYATLKPNRGGSKRGLARELEGGGEKPQDQQQNEQTLLTRHDSELSLNEALNRSLLMATQAMEELSAMSAKEAEEKTTNQRPPSGLSQGGGGGFDGEIGASRSPTPSSGTLRRNSSLCANRPPPPVRRSSSLSTNGNAEQNPSLPNRTPAPQNQGVAVTRSQSVAASDVSHAPPTGVSATSVAPSRGGDDGSVARGRTALMESLNAKLGGGSPQAKMVPVHPKSLGQRDPSPSFCPRPLAPGNPTTTNQPFALQPHPYASSSSINTRPAPPPPPPPTVAQSFANPGLASGGGTGLLGTDELRSSLLSEIKAVGSSGFRGLRAVRPEGVNDRSAPRIN